VEGSEYIVTSLVLHYKLQRGKYVRDHNKLKVQRTGRYLYNSFLTSLMDGPDARPEVGKKE
jgi:hypothetical protein